MATTPPGLTVRSSMQPGRYVVHATSGRKLLGFITGSPKAGWHVHDPRMVRLTTDAHPTRYSALLELLPEESS